MENDEKSVKPVIVVHGGAWKIPDELLEDLQEGAKMAALAGHEVLKDGGSCIDAVVAAVTEMEDLPSFDAGRGSVLNEAGEVEMHAMVMRGDTLDVGSVLCIQNVKNPVQAAKLVLDKSHHSLLNGHAGLEMAGKYGLPSADLEFFITDYARKEFEMYKSYGSSVSELFNAGHDTVGAVALDRNGNLACATSTGGITAQQVGRVSDSPLPGSGGYADNDSVAVSTTGHGESILKVNLAKGISVCVENGMSPREATVKCLNHMKSRVGGCGGAISVDRLGRIGMHYSTPQMTWARIGGQFGNDHTRAQEECVEYGCNFTNVRKELI